METTPPINDIECREPKEVDLRFSTAVDDMVATTAAADIRFGLYLSGCGVAAALVIMGFLIYELAG